MARKENPIVRAAKAVVKPLKDAAKQIEDTVEQEAPRPAPDSKKDKPGDAKFVRGVGERLGFGGVVVFTVVAALFGAVGCNEATSAVLPVATCVEPAVWCGGAQR